ncbi:MAG TPA: YciI family protein [Hyphomonadaceae bacterium]|nr:YciI family protein [Hyphomonadaceae bacterium]
MQFMMFVCSDTQPDDQPEKPGEIQAWLADLERSGKRVTGDRLKPKREARTVRVRKGKLLVTDGPYTEAKEVIVGFDILNCDSMEEAIAIAAKHPMARAGRIEVRAFWQDE